MKRQLTILEKEIPSIDLFRLISAFLVVTVHVKPRPFDDLLPGVSYLTTSVFARAALMYFFVVSGFFLAKRIAEKGPASVWRFVGRLWVSYTIWFAIYFWFDYGETIKAGVDWAQFLPKLALDYFLWGGNLQLWFVPALCICCILFWLFSVLKLDRLYYCTALPLALVGLLANPYRALGRKTFLEPFYNSALYSPLRRIFFMGMPVFLIGAILYATLDFWMRRKKQTTDALLLASLMFFIAEPALLNRFALNDGLLITLFLYPLEFFLLLWCIRNPMPRLAPHAAAMREDSRWIYYGHYLFIFAIDELSEFGGAYVSISFDFVPTVEYALVMTFTLCFAGILRRCRSVNRARGRRFPEWLTPAAVFAALKTLLKRLVTSRKLKHLLLVFLCVAVVAVPLSLFSDRLTVSFGESYSYTGKYEEGTLSIWCSPEISRNRTDNAKMIRDAADRLPFYNEVEITNFSDRETFFRTLSLAVMSGEGPDVVVASQNEWSPKILQTGLLLDLKPFLNDCFKKGILDKSALTWNLFTESETNGKLYLSPLWFVPEPISSYQDESGLLNLAAAPSFDDLCDTLSGISGDDALLASALDGIAPPELAFPDLVDYRYYDTRLQDREVQTYINTYIRALCAAQNGAGSAVYFPGCGDYQSERQLDFVTETGCVTPVSIPVCVGVTANAPHLQKALAYMESLYGEEWAIVRSSDNGVLSVFRGVLVHVLSAMYPDAQVQKMLPCMQERNFRVVWVDPDTRHSLTEFYKAHIVQYEEGGPYEALLPTEEEYAALHQQICKSLGE